MSFDSEFDFANITGYISTSLTDCNADIDTIDGDLAMAGNVGGNAYEVITQQYVDNMNRKKSRFQNRSNSFVTIQGQLNTIANISGNNKSMLYDFYTTHFVNYTGINYTAKKDFMSRLMYNPTGFITDAENIMVNDPPSAETANLVTKLVVEGYPISMYTRFI